MDLLHANPTYAHIKFPDGRETTASLKDLAPFPRRLDDENIINSKRGDDGWGLVEADEDDDDDEEEEEPTRRMLKKDQQSLSSSPLDDGGATEEVTPGGAAEEVTPGGANREATPNLRRSQRARRSPQRLNYSSLGGSNH